MREYPVESETLVISQRRASLMVSSEFLHSVKYPYIESQSGHSNHFLKGKDTGTFLMVQWLRFFQHQEPGFDPWSRNEIPHAQRSRMLQERSCMSQLRLSRAE